MSIGEEAVKKIRQAMAENNVNASGDTDKSLFYEETEFSLKIGMRGRHAPAFTLEKGRGPFRALTGRVGLKEALQKWIRQKNGVLQSIKNRAQTEGRKYKDEDALVRSCAFAMARKINREGTRLHASPRNNITTPALQWAVAEFTKKVKFAIVQTFLNDENKKN